MKAHLLKIMPGTVRRGDVKKESTINLKKRFTKIESIGWTLPQIRPLGKRFSEHRDRTYSQKSHKPNNFFLCLFHKKLINLISSGYLIRLHIENYHEISIFSTKN